MRVKILNEKFLVFCLFVISIATMFLIMMNLPTDVQHVVDKEKNLLHRVFVPDHENRLNHNDAHQHEAPPFFNNEEKGGKNSEENLINKDSNKKKSVDFDIPDIIIKKSSENFEKVRGDVNNVDEKNDAENDNIENENESVNHKSKKTMSVLEKRDYIKKMTLFGWSNYEKFAWGENELKPISKRGHSAGIFGSRTKLGATIVDGLDTLYLMGYFDEYQRGKDWIEKNFNLNVNSDISLFEVNIRFIGGFLSLYTLTKEKMFLTKAEEVATLLLPAFETKTGIPYALVNPITKRSKNYNWASGGCAILAEFGTLSLEFNYLSDLTGNMIFSEKIKKIEETLAATHKESGLYYNYIHPSTGKWCVKHATIGALADSFYEYLFKSWIYSGKKDDTKLETYLTAMEAFNKNMLSTSKNNLTYFHEIQNGRQIKKMDHLACFSGGLLAYTADNVPSLKNHDQILNYAKGITNTCHESYIRTNTHLGPESFRFERDDMEAMALKSQDKYYILRPEVIEAYFYLYRVTKNEMYRDWAWDAAQAIEKYCRTPNGYSGISDVYASDGSIRHDDVQQSFFFAETLKYLFLIFSNDDVLPLDKYVFNTEAHPFLIAPPKATAHHHDTNQKIINQ